MNKILRCKAKVYAGGGIFLCALLLSMAPATTGSYRSVAAQDVNVPKFFSTKINVSNLEKSLDFYTRIMGLKVTARVGNDRFAEIVLTRTGEGAGASEQALILVYSEDQEKPLDLGNAFNNLLFVFPDLKECLKQLDAAGYVVTGSREPRPLSIPFAKAVTILYTKDPDGYTLELVQYFN